MGFSLCRGIGSSACRLKTPAHNFSTFICTLLQMFCYDQLGSKLCSSADGLTSWQPCKTGGTFLISDLCLTDRSIYWKCSHISNPNFVGLTFFETSAKDNVNVKAVFDILVDVILEKIAEGGNQDGDTGAGGVGAPGSTFSEAFTSCL